MSDEIQLSVSLPLDGDGFLRRECPACERQFKWLPSSDSQDEDDASAATADASGSPENYHCPYCAVAAPSDAWLTKAQVAVMHEIVRREILDPKLDEFERTIDKLNRKSGGWFEIEASLERDEPEPAPELDESDDMRSVDFPCHPSEPVKVLEDWGRPLHCLICGEAAVL